MIDSGKKTIRVLLVEPMKHPRVVEMKHTLSNMQKMVGGYITAMYPWNDPVALICDDEGYIKGSRPNRMLEGCNIIAGNFLICGLTHDNFGTLSDEMIHKYMHMFYYPEVFIRTEDGLTYFRLKGAEEEGQ